MALNNKYIIWSGRGPFSSHEPTREPWNVVPIPVPMILDTRTNMVKCHDPYYGIRIAIDVVDLLEVTGKPHLSFITFI